MAALDGQGVACEGFIGALSPFTDFAALATAIVLARAGAKRRAAGAVPGRRRDRGARGGRRSVGPRPGSRAGHPRRHAAQPGRLRPPARPRTRNAHAPRRGVRELPRAAVPGAAVASYAADGHGGLEPDGRASRGRPRLCPPRPRRALPARPAKASPSASPPITRPASRRAAWRCWRPWRGRVPTSRDRRRSGRRCPKPIPPPISEPRPGWGRPWPSSRSPSGSRRRRRWSAADTPPVGARAFSHGGRPPSEPRPSPSRARVSGTPGRRLAGPSAERQREGAALPGPAARGREAASARPIPPTAPRIGVQGAAAPSNRSRQVSRGAPDAMTLQSRTRALAGGSQPASQAPLAIRSVSDPSKP